ncbi:MAG TPA: phosphohistidine phosphatase SixA [Candidatus Limnocylindria bacterium]|jgi:phosphohistidine phosphatase|nr:phosphohistidine phosphatase SixA [Candidatus Limnocylindria bacterium]
MKLYLLRHGDAVDPAEWKRGDAERPLTDDGRKRIARATRTMRRLGFDVDRIVTSPLLRARQTAEIVAVEFAHEDRVVADPRLGAEFGPEQLAEILRDNHGVEDLLLVGHEPSMSGAIAHLIGGGSIKLKKGALARIDLPDPARLSGTLEWLLPP